MLIRTQQETIPVNRIDNAESSKHKKAAVNAFEEFSIGHQLQFHHTSQTTVPHSFLGHWMLSDF